MLFGLKTLTNTAVFGPGAGETCPETVIVAAPKYVAEFVCTVIE
jgi:hypothetical protein